MSRSTPLLFGTLLAALFSACAANQFALPRTVASSVTGQQCPIRVQDAFVGNWKQVRSEGFTFCVPTDWALDARYRGREGAKRGSIFRLLSYASPDTLERVVFEVPTGGNSLALLKTEFARCQYINRFGVTMIGDQPVCNFNMRAVTYSAPYVRGRATGWNEALAVLQTVRASEVGERF